MPKHDYWKPFPSIESNFHFRMGLYWYKFSATKSFLILPNFQNY